MYLLCIKIDATNIWAKLWVAAPAIEMPYIEKYFLHLSNKVITQSEKNAPDNEYNNAVNPEKSIETTKHFIIETDKAYQ